MIECPIVELENDLDNQDFEDEFRSDSLPEKQLTKEVKDYPSEISQLS